MARQTQGWQPAMSIPHGQLHPQGRLHRDATIALNAVARQPYIVHDYDEDDTVIDTVMLQL